MALVLGYDSAFDLQVVGASFPAEAAFTAHVRAQVDAPAILATLTTAAGRVTRLTADTLRVSFPGSMTASWPTSVVLDLVRTDVTPDDHLGFRLRCSFTRPVTRGLA